MVGVCSVKECEKDSRKKGFCLHHYYMNKEYGDPNAVPPPRKKQTKEEREESAKQAQRRYNINHKQKIKEKNADPNRGKKYKAKYNKTDKGKAANKRKYAKQDAKPERKQKKKDWRNSPEIVERKKLERLEIRMDVFSHYSKLHSNSNFPICRCCHENIYEFLNLDHIVNADEMELLPEAKAWGFQAKWADKQLLDKIKKNDYPDGFQILCSSCNQSKKNSGSWNRCLHQLVLEPNFVINETVRRRRRRKVFSHYSKKHDNSDTPICHCCGESFFEFLTIDHIQGKIVMDSFTELTDLGYSSDKEVSELLKWIIDHKFFPNFETEYFQVMCYNCNQAKGHSADTTCPHEKIRKEETFAMMEEQSSFESGF